MDLLFYKNRADGICIRSGRIFFDAYIEYHELFKYNLISSKLLQFEDKGDEEYLNRVKRFSSYYFFTDKLSLTFMLFALLHQKKPNEKRVKSGKPLEFKEIVTQKIEEEYSG